MESKKQKTKLIERMNRIEGQIRGLKQMIEKERPCFEILKQVSAARGALRSLGQVILQEHLEECISSFSADDKKTKEFKDNLVQLFSKICSHE
ncbi:MAG TPA: metal-sensitive transcriptional regulator [Candidatus Hydrogenedens sp.]|nr:metal-sensitive transcriptional regulator [Candidatus Hydrogenedens sp.]HOK08870.1 metal-sensitive transcriptional regulator [Candidatus Hydrogenedens sp.]HOL20360.1 metal-sensitive transcriptional regulator [Candidatus Hydrogenedens sp.]HPP58831.1 metal-sensitive transcriptional regulator [Candidatus Hydrogenedens sp.]